MENWSNGITLTFARLIYADALVWTVDDVSQLREYVKEVLNSYNLEGDYYEYIVPNFNNSLRESRLYADIVANKKGEPEWSNPLNWSTPIIPFEPVELKLVKAMSKIGIFKKTRNKCNRRNLGEN